MGQINVKFIFTRLMEKYLEGRILLGRNTLQIV